MSGNSSGQIIRVVKNRENPYSMVSNEMINDQELSWEACGVLTYLLSKPDNWQVRTDHLINFRRGGRDRMTRILAELEALGYLSRQKHHNELGHWVQVSVIYEFPHQPQPEKPAQANPVQVSPTQAKPAIQQVRTTPNTNGINTEGEGGRAHSLINNSRAPSAEPTREPAPTFDLDAWEAGRAERERIARRARGR